MLKSPLPNFPLLFFPVAVFSNKVCSTMGTFLVLNVLILFLFIYLCPAATSSAFSMTKPGCQETCGNISVPYPFGIGDENCFRDPSFHVICNDTYYDPPRLFWYNFEVTDISLQGQQRILNYVGRDCYNSMGTSTFHANTYLFLNGNTFTISDTENKFAALGCDTQAILYGNAQNFTTGCVMISFDNEYLLNGSCTGIGCCQTSIPKGSRYFEISVSSYHNHTFVYDFNPCSYVFIVDYNWYNFSTSDLLNFTDYIDQTGWPRAPLWLDWAIAWPTESTNSCEEAMKNQTSYACGNNVCGVSKNGLGYNCSCSQGYQGNPYLQDGCQDINECAVPNNTLCTSSSSCTNLPGTYNCSCTHGSQGDGWTNGTGCTPPPFPVIKVAFASVLGGGFGLSFLLFGSLWLHKVFKERRENKLKQKFFQQNGGFLLQQKISSEKGGIEKTKVFSDEELKKATDNYNENRILGHGGQGTVYKGMLSDGTIVAIKKSTGIHDQGQIKEFINEIAILSQISHRNVVKLFGCCLETEVPLLVYEFISNGTLFTHIHDSGGELSFTWDSRLRIAKEVAGALAYLHYAASIPVYHRDIKSTNILLDDRHRAKVSDFGISRSVSVDKTHLTVTSVQGTLGYLDPEYFQSSQFTDKSDVYSFGVVLVELLTGKELICSTRPEGERSLVANFINSMEENNFLEMLDSQVVEEGKHEELETVAEIAYRCLNMNGKKRPTMKEVVAKLEVLRDFPSENLFARKIKQDECIMMEPIGLWDSSSVSPTAWTTSTSVAIPLADRPLLQNSSS